MPPLRIAELFAGIGGVTGGLLDAGGYESVALIDSDPLAATAFSTNFPELAPRYAIRSIGARVTGSVLLELAGGSIDGILGCPPCQGLSQAGLRQADDARNLLLFEMRRLIKAVRPRFFLMENVPGLLHSSIYEEFTAALDHDYLLCGEAVNAAEYGVPQLRRRAVVLGIRRDLGVQPSLPSPTHGGTGWVFDYFTGRYVTPGKQTGRNLLKLRPIKPKAGPRLVLPPLPLVTLGEALGDLPHDVPLLSRGPTAKNAVDEAVDYYAVPSTDYQVRIRGAATQALNHRAWRHGDELTQRLTNVAPGDCPASGGGRSRNVRYFSQAYARLHEDGLARTVTTNFHNPGGGRFTHYAAPRTLTLREAMRVQGFPDTFRFDEMHASDAERLIGNAFPRLLAEAIGGYVAKLLSAAA